MPFSCATHVAQITDRGGKNVLGVIEPLTSVSWGRKADGIVEANINIALPSMACLGLLERVSANRHELVIYRDGERVWEGPITRIGRHADTFDISARDVGHYLYRTVMHNEYDNTAAWTGSDFHNRVAPVVDRAEWIITQELTRTKENVLEVDPVINVLPFLTTVRYSDISLERRTMRHTLPYAMTVWDDLESMMRTGGLDYTVVGRRIILNDTRVPLGQTPVVSEDDFIGEVIVTSYGMDSFTRAFTTGANGMYGESGGVDPYYGEWENVEQMFDADSEEEPTQNALDNAADYNMVDRLPVPTVVRLPENTRLNPKGTLNIGDLVPGVRMPLRARLTSTQVTQMMKLRNVSVTEDEDKGEVIKIIVAPAPSEIEEP